MLARRRLRLATQPIESAAPNESTEPAAPNQPTESAAPNESTESAAPNQPTESAAPNESTESAAHTRPRVLFLCTHNSARSQMAEGMLRAWGGDRFEAHSAGIEVTRVRPEAIAVMDELGIDLRTHRSKHVAEFADELVDWAITTCDEDCAACPVFPGAGRREYWVFDDPSAVGGSPEERLATFRRIRDEIAGRIRDFIGRAGT